MSASEMVTTIAGGSLGLIILILSVIQIAPIKVNPWSYILKKLGNTMNEEIIEKVDRLGNELKGLQKSCDERAMNDCRTRILRFNDEIIHGIRHTKEHFDQILIDISTYESYCGAHGDYKNNIANLAIERIKSTYIKCGDEGTFL